MSRKALRWGCVTAALLLTIPLAAGVSGASAKSAPKADSSSPRVLPTTSGVLKPISARHLRPSHVPIAARIRAARAVEAKREAIDAAVAHPVGAGRSGKVTGSAGRQTVVRGDDSTETLSIRRNFRNTRAQAVSSTLAEPAAANDANEVFYTGNTYASYSSNHGSTWAARALHAGPAEANIPCCDADVVHHAPTDTTFTSLLYTNAAQTNGVIDIEVRKGSPSTVDCIYRIDPGGTANNVLPDYPHIAVTNGFLFLSTNNQGPTGWTGANTRRFNESQMSNCQSTSFTSFNYVGSVGQRVHVPGETQQGVTCEYWAQYENSSTIRWFQWCDGSASPSNFTRSTTSTNFSNPDCRGGTGNFDFIERSTAWSITGFRGRTAVGGGQVAFLINAAPDASHPQAHLHGQVISRSTLGVVANPVVWNSSTCFGFPALGSNSRNDLGLSMAFGGRAGGGGSAAQGGVAVDDASSSGIFFPSISLTASGTHNRSDSRFGDYFTVRGNDQCPGAWSATNYALLNGNTSSSNVNARYVEFQSTSQAACP